jgi:dolichol-phosphate mannosyltransferase
MLSLILPTYNEAESLPLVLPKIMEALAGTSYEIIVVDDDSPDKTTAAAERLAAELGSIRVVCRKGEKGLSSAVIRGFLEARGDICLVMDADGQHDPALLLSLAAAVRGGAHIAIGSRYVAGGGVGGWNIGRKMLSAGGTVLTRLALGITVHDPLSGFFAIERARALRAIEGVQVEGFKILLDLLARLPRPLRLAEIPLQFRTRLRGESKLSFHVHLAVLRTILPLIARRFGLPVFLAVCAVLVVLFLARLWPIRLLYLDPQVRQKTEQVMRRLADEQGWNLSDLSLQSLTASDAVIIHRAHVRGPDPQECMQITFDSFARHPCAN